MPKNKRICTFRNGFKCKEGECNELRRSEVTQKCDLLTLLILMQQRLSNLRSRALWCCESTHHLKQNCTDKCHELPS